MTRRDISLLPPSLAPFGVSRETAAELVGIGATVFDQMVVDGRMPQPRVASQKRFVWDVQELLAAGKGFHTWSVEEVRQYEAKHPLGSRARLALDIALYTGLRRQEVAILGRQHVKDGWIRITPGKTKKSSGAVVEIPMLPELAASIAATPTGDLTFLTSAYGEALAVDGRGNRVRGWCDRADLTHCTRHGLRKAGATIAAENGATDEELMAIFGWTTKQQTTTYTRAADRKRLAKGAIHKLRPTDPKVETGNKFPAPKSAVRKSAGKTAK